jgi:hypothetical protein
MKNYTIFGKKIEASKVNIILRKIAREAFLAAVALVAGFCVWLVMSL